MVNRKIYFADYKSEAHNWITLAGGEYYPDVLKDAVELYTPVLVVFGQLLKKSHSATHLFEQVCELKEQWIRIQLARIFRKYVSPDLPVEMLKKKTQVQDICQRFSKSFRPINEVQRAFLSRPLADEVICALLWEYKDRGKKGYDLTERLFNLLAIQLPTLTLKGPQRAGKDVLMKEIFEDYPNPKRPVDFVIYEGERVLAIGLARYDGDRGGAQEDDRTGGYTNCADEILNYAKSKHPKLKLIFVNDGPGLLLGSMWDDYANLENRTDWQDKIMVTTLRMIPDRLTLTWLKS
ncbi:MAG: hypothetical protein JNM36_11825 [Chitinophagales bacterium]|nr:hypothetical protein [Chitinophagales bacterium]